MKIPEDIKIGYKEYKVNKVEGDVIEGNKVCYGNIKYDAGEINISMLHSKDQQMCTLVHEVIHGIDDIYEIELEEDQVRKLAKGIYALIKENKKMFLE